MRKIVVVVAVAIVAAGVLVPTAASAVGAPDQLVLSQVTSDSGTLTGDATPVSLVTVNADGSPSTDSAVALPVADSGSNHTLTLSGTSDAQGSLSLSADGSGLAIGGFDETPAAGTGLDDPGALPAATDKRVIGWVTANGTVDTSTTMGSAYDLGNIRSVASADGSAFYTAGKDSATGIYRETLGGTTPTAITSKDKNFRTIGISGDQLYSSSDKTSTVGLSLIGSGLPTASIPKVATTPMSTATVMVDGAVGTPDGFTLLDSNGDGSPDTAYLIVEGAGIYKFGLNGSTWAAEGSIPGDFESLTGTANESGVTLYTLSHTTDAAPDANKLLKFTDTAGSLSPVTTASPTTVATAAAGTAWRGVAFAPTGWAPPVVTPPDTSKPTAKASPAADTALVGDTLTSTITLGDSKDGVDASGFSLAATASTDSSVVAAGDVTISGTGLTRTVTVTPQAVGITSVTLTATDPDSAATGSTNFTVGASAATPGLDNVVYHNGEADASSAIDVGDGYMLVADDENTGLGLFQRNVDGPAIKTFDFTSQLGSGELDLEAAARSGNTIYWFGSHSNTKDDVYQASRSVFFTTTVTGSGADTELTFGASYTNLRTDLLAWDAGHDNRLGLDSACSLAGGSNPDTTTGCNIEGFDFAADGTTGYVGFRAPSIDGKALIVPVTNITSLPGASGPAEFGDPIELDLGGRTIREIRSNGHGDFLITAGAPDDLSPTVGWALYRWNGVASSKPILVTNLPTSTGADGQEVGSFESIVSVPAVPSAGTSIQLLTDNGTTVFYGNGVAGKDVSPAALQKFRSDTVDIGTVGVPDATLLTASVPAGQTDVVGGVGFVPGEPVKVDLDGANIDTVDASASGVVTTTESIPSATSVGTHHVAITGVASGLAETADLDVSAALHVFTKTPTPTISGTAKVGDKLTSAHGTWAPGTVAFTYQWNRGDEPIEGATSSTYTATGEDAGEKITVSVTGSEEGFAPVTKPSAATKTVASAVLTTHKPTVTSVRDVGETLAAKVAAWGPAPVALRYQWKRSGVAIPDATDSTYQIAAADAGHNITVTVTGTKAGYTTATSTSSSALIHKQLTTTPVPTITGTAKVGSKVTAVRGTWAPTGIAFTYRWFRDGVAIPSATHSYHTLTSADSGKAITVRVTGSRSGYTTVAETSAGLDVPGAP
jgi:hypothetical protein